MKLRCNVETKEGKPLRLEVSHLICRVSLARRQRKTMRSSSQAATCHPSTTLGGNSPHYPLIYAERQVGKIPILMSLV